MLNGRQIRQLDKKLLGLLKLVDGQEYPHRVRSTADRIIRSCTAKKGGGPGGSLLRPDWQPTWKTYGFVASGWFSPTEDIDKGGVDALFDAIQELVRLVSDANTPSLYELHVGNLQKQCRKYLAIRGYEVREALPSLNDDQKTAIRYIKKHGPVGGKEIADHVGVSFEHFRKWVGKQGVLTAHGVRNDRNGAGYYWRRM